MVIESSRLGRAIPHVFQDFRRDVVGAARACGDVVQPALQQGIGVCLIPYPLPYGPVHHRAGSRCETPFPPVFQLAGGFKEFVMAIEGSEQVSDSFSRGSHSV
ncbi:MAG TPA: hypothetical protein VIV83_14420 [Gemmatimonadales bacterium]